MPLANVATTFCGVEGFVITTRTTGGGEVEVTVNVKLQVPVWPCPSTSVPDAL